MSDLGDRIRRGARDLEDTRLGRWLRERDDRADTDDDGLSNADERARGTNPGLPDSDFDGVDDGDEVNAGTNPTNRDTDGDGLTDGDEVGLGTDPLNRDTDGDGLIDGDEVEYFGSDPTKADTDGDGLTDHAEVLAGTDPDNVDTDGDGVSDGDEVGQGSDPTAPPTPGGAGESEPEPESLYVDPAIPGQDGFTVYYDADGNVTKVVTTSETLTGDDAQRYWDAYEDLATDQGLTVPSFTDGEGEPDDTPDASPQDLLDPDSDAQADGSPGTETAEPVEPAEPDDDTPIAFRAIKSLLNSEVEYGGRMRTIGGTRGDGQIGGIVGGSSGAVDDATKEELENLAKDPNRPSYIEGQKAGKEFKGGLDEIKERPSSVDDPGQTGHAGSSEREPDDLLNPDGAGESDDSGLTTPAGLDPAGASSRLGDIGGRASRAKEFDLSAGDMPGVRPADSLGSRGGRGGAPAGAGGGNGSGASTSTSPGGPTGSAPTGAAGLDRSQIPTTPRPGKTGGSSGGSSTSSSSAVGSSTAGTSAGGSSSAGSSAGGETDEGSVEIGIDFDGDGVPDTIIDEDGNIHESETDVGTSEDPTGDITPVPDDADITVEPVGVDDTDTDPDEIDQGTGGGVVPHDTPSDPPDGEEGSPQGEVDPDGLVVGVDETNTDPADGSFTGTGPLVDPIGVGPTLDNNPYDEPDEQPLLKTVTADVSTTNTPPPPGYGQVAMSESDLAHAGTGPAGTDGDDLDSPSTVRLGRQTVTSLGGTAKFDAGSVMGDTPAKGTGDAADPPAEPAPAPVFLLAEQTYSVAGAETTTGATDAEQATETSRGSDADVSDDSSMREPIDRGRGGRYDSKRSFDHGIDAPTTDAATSEWDDGITELAEPERLADPGGHDDFASLDEPAVAEPESDPPLEPESADEAWEVGFE